MTQKEMHHIQKKKDDDFRSVKTWHHEFFAYSENKKYTNRISFSVQIVELFALHLTV